MLLSNEEGPAVDRCNAFVLSLIARASVVPRTELMKFYVHESCQGERGLKGAADSHSVGLGWTLNYCISESIFGSSCISESLSEMWNEAKRERVFVVA